VLRSAASDCLLSIDLFYAISIMVEVYINVCVCMWKMVLNRLCVAFICYLMEVSVSGLEYYLLFKFKLFFVIINLLNRIALPIASLSGEEVCLVKTAA